jgi:hypothetical protein
MTSFENTEIAFKSKTDSQLKKAYWLFKIISFPIIVKIGKLLTPIALKLHLPIKGLIKSTIFSQFCGGESINECSKTIENLGKFGVGTILDYSVEGQESLEEVENTVHEIIKTIERGANDPNIPFAVFKVTGVASFSLLEKASLKASPLYSNRFITKFLKPRNYPFCATNRKLTKTIIYLCWKEASSATYTQSAPPKEFRKTISFSNCKEKC